MNQPPFALRGPWYRNNVRVAGFVIAGQCVLSMVFFGFGLMLMGTLLTAVSSKFDWKPGDAFYDPNATNIPRLIGTILLSIGGVLFGFGLIFLIIAISKARSETQSNATQQGHVVTGAGYQQASSFGGIGVTNYPTTQPYQTPGQPLLSGGVGQQTYPYQTAGQPLISGGVGQQTYPYQTAGQPLISGGVGQQYPTTGQGQPYPVGVSVPQQGGPHESSHYPRQAMKTDEVTNNPYNAGSALPYPSEYPGSGQPPPQNAPPPYHM